MSSLSLIAPIHELPLPTTPEVWLPYAKAMSLCQRGVRWMHLQVQSSEIRVRLTARTLGNGRPDREVLLSTLPEAAQRRYAAEAAMMPAQPSLALALTGPQLITAPRIAVPTAKMSGAQRRDAILRPVLEMQHAHKRIAAAQQYKLADGRPVDSQNRMIEYQVEQAIERGEDLSMRTVKRWVAAHKQDGVAGLARRRRSDAGASRFFVQHEAAAALVAYLYLGDSMSPGLSAQACYDMLCAQREVAGLTADNLPTVQTVRHFLRTITPAVRTLALKGRKVFGEQMLPYLSRAYNEPSNSWWVSDHMICDVEVLNDCMPGAPLGAPLRLRLTAIIDYRSRYVVGWTFAVEGTSYSIGTAIRRAVEQHGPCERWYCDNGKDYVKAAKGAIPGYMRAAEAEEWVQDEMRRIEGTGILARLGVRVTRCIAHHPQSKHVERFFRTVHLTFCKLWPTYTGGKPSERPEQTEALMHAHRRAMRHGDLTRSHHPLATEFIARFETWLATYHNKRGHRGRGMGYGSPAEVFERYRNPNQRPAPAPEELAYLMWERTSAVVRECQLHVNKQDYAASGPNAALHSSILMSLNGRGKVPVAYDPLDPHRIAVLDEDGRLLVLLEAKRLTQQAPDDPETQRQIGEMQRLRSILVREVREQHTSLITTAKGLGVVTPLQLLAAATPETPSPAPATLQESYRITPRKAKPTQAKLSALPSTARSTALRLIAMQQEETH